MNWSSSYCLFIIITGIYIGQNCLAIQFAEHTYQSPTIDLRETLSQRKATKSKSIGQPNALLMQKYGRNFGKILSPRQSNLLSNYDKDHLWCQMRQQFQLCQTLPHHHKPSVR